MFTNECDVMLSPTSCNIAPLIEDIVNGNKKNTNDDIEDPKDEAKNNENKDGVGGEEQSKPI